MNASLTRSQTKHGLLFGLAAYSWWGLVPLYFKSVAAIPPLEQLAHRAVWSALFLLGLILVTSRWKDLVACFQSRRKMLGLVCSMGFIATNWYVFVYGVVTRQSLQNSLGYFILPLVNVAIGVLFYHERLRKLQTIALLLATAGVLVIIVDLGTLPWISLTLAFSFCFYGILRKQIAVDPIVGLAMETLLLTPIAFAFLIYWSAEGQLVFGHLNRSLDLLVLLGGIVTTTPLLFFTVSVRRLSLITVGFLQYISPSMQFLLAVFIFGEAFTPAYQLCFGLIWTGLLCFLIDALHQNRKSKQATKNTEQTIDP